MNRDRFDISGVALFLVLVATYVSPLWAQGKELTAFRDRWAILVGVSEYMERSDLRPLKEPSEDVRRMARILTQRGKFNSDHITTLIDAQATCLEINKAFQKLIGKVGPEDMILFYFSGYGSRIEDSLFPDESDRLDECLLPYDAEVEFGINYLRDDEIGRYLYKLGAKSSVIINDSSYLGNGSSEKGITNRDALVVEGEKDGITEGDYLPPGTVVLEACGSEETTKDGVFTPILIEGLGGPADSNGDGIITVAESFDHVQKEMKRRNINQAPQLLGAPEAARIALVQPRPAVVSGERKVDRRKEVTDSTKTESKVEGEQESKVLRIEPARIHIRADIEIAGKLVENIPLDAKIYLDSRENLCAEKLPATLDNVRPGDHKLIIHVEGWQFTGQISVKPGESVTESIHIAQSVAWQASLKLLRSTPQDKDRLEKAQEVARALGRSDVAEIFEKRIEQGK